MTGSNGAAGPGAPDLLELAARLSSVEHAQSRHGAEWSEQRSLLSGLADSIAVTNDGLAELQRQLSEIVKQLKHLSLSVPMLARRNEARRKPKRGK